MKHHHGKLVPSLLARCVAEFIGTFFLMCAVGTNTHSESIGGAISVGATLTVMVYSLGSVSGGHFNPAVTLAVWLSGRNKIVGLDGVCYVVSQLAAAVCGVLFSWATSSPQGAAASGVHDRFLLPAPGLTYVPGHAFGVELLYSMMLCYVVLNVATTDKAHNASGPNASFGFAIGMSVTSSAIAISPISGCSLNPALSVGSAIASRLAAAGGAAGFVPWRLWAPYVLAPMLGAFTGAAAFWLVRGGLFNRYEYALGDEVLSRTKSPALGSGEACYKQELSASSPTAGSVRLVKDQFIPLPAEVVKHELVCNLRWRWNANTQRSAGSTESVDLDLSCVKFGRTGDCLGAVYFANKQDVGLRHGGDGDQRSEQEQIFMRLPDCKENVQALVFVVMTYSGQKFDALEYQLTLSEALKGGGTGEDICHNDKKDTKEQGNAQIAAILSRSPDGKGWFFKAIDEPHVVPPNSSYRKLMVPLQAQVAAALGPSATTGGADPGASLPLLPRWPWNMPADVGGKMEV
jgi:aquaporin Z